MNPSTKLFFSIVGSVLSGVILASWVSISQTSHQVVRVEEKIEAIKLLFASNDQRFQNIESRLSKLESK